MEVKRSFKVAPTGRIRVIFTDDMVATLKRIDPTEDAKETKAFKAVCYQEGYPHRPVPGKPLLVLKMNATVAEISHEALHATYAILRYAGVRFSPTNDEQVAYLLDYIVDKIVKIMSRPPISRIIVNGKN